MDSANSQTGQKNEGVSFSDLLALQLQGLDEENFYGVCDVVLDVEQELRMGANEIVIPLMRSVVRFPILIPGDSINMRDRYCALRYKAIGFLKNEGAVLTFRQLQGGHRWQNRVEVVINTQKFEALAAATHGEQERREGPSGAGAGSTGVDMQELIGRICERFHLVARQLLQRHDARPTLAVGDEYDVQDLLHAILRLHFDDIRPEEWTPSYAGKSARMDFFLREAGTVIEVKKSRVGLDEKKLGDELLVDIARYRKHKDCGRLVCLIYDPEERIKNPRGLEGDLSSQTDGLTVDVHVVPRR